MLLLLGLRYLRKGFARLFGGDLLDWLQATAHSRTRAFGAGAVAGAIMPSSTAMAFLSVQLTREGKAPWATVFALLLGAQLGITALVHLLSLQITDFAGLFLAFGGGFFLFFNATKTRGCGQILLAFGCMLLGMGLIGEAARFISTDPNLQPLFAALENLPGLFFFTAMLLALALQSSTAVIAVGIGLGVGGAIDPSMLLLWVLGTNMGLCLTVLVAGWGRLDGRRLGVAILLTKLPLAIVLSLLVLRFPQSTIDALNLPIAQQAAFMHTLFNLLAGYAVFFALNIEKLTKKLIPYREVEPDELSRLDSRLLEHPPLALNACLRELLTLLETLRLFLAESAKGVRTGAVAPQWLPSIRQRGHAAEKLCNELDRFIDKIETEALDKDDRELRDALDYLCREYPFMLKVAARELPEEIERFLREPGTTIAQLRPIIEQAASRCDDQLRAVDRMLMQQDSNLAVAVVEQKKSNSTWLTRHKLQPGNSPLAYREILDDFQQLNRRLCGIALTYHDQANALDDAEE